MSTDRQTSSEPFAPRIEKILLARRGDYAHPQDNHQLTADLWQAWLSARLPSSCSSQSVVAQLPGRITPEDVCILNILQKVSRLAHGTHDDSLLDIVGYVENIGMLRPDQRNTINATEVPRCQST